MRHFVKLTLPDGRAVAWPVDEIKEVRELTPGVQKVGAVQGCVLVTTRGAPSFLEAAALHMWCVIGDVDAVLRLIAAAQFPERD